MRRTVAAITMAGMIVGGGALWLLVQGSGAQAGDALGLDEGSVVTFSGGIRRVGQELIIVFEGFSNESSSPIEITDVSFEDDNIENVEFIEIGVIPREVRGGGFQMGTYGVAPPSFVSPIDDECVSHDIESFQRRLEPGEGYLLAYHVKFPNPGPYRFDYPQIHYRSESREFFEVARVELFGEVEDSREAVTVDVTQAPCVDDDDLLPGNTLTK